MLGLCESQGKKPNTSSRNTRQYSTRSGNTRLTALRRAPNPDGHVPIDHVQVRSLSDEFAGIWPNRGQFVSSSAAFAASGPESRLQALTSLVYTSKDLVLPLVSSFRAQKGFIVLAPAPLRTTIPRTPATTLHWCVVDSRMQTSLKGEPHSLTS